MDTLNSIVSMDPPKEDGKRYGISNAYDGVFEDENSLTTITTFLVDVLKLRAIFVILNSANPIIGDDSLKVKPTKKHTTIMFNQVRNL